MKTYRCVIVEDEDFATKLITEYITKHPQLELVDAFESPVDLIPLQNSLQFDILFLDIYMPEMTGIDLIKNFQFNCEVIMTTASPDHAIDCFPLKVVDYLLKPIKLDRFMSAVQRAIQLIELQNKSETVESPNNRKEHLMVKADKRLIKVIIEDIHYVEAAWEYVKIHTSKESHMVMMSIKKIQDELADHDFFRIHRSYLVNLNHFAFIEGNQICINKVKLPISRNYKQDLLAEIADL